MPDNRKRVYWCANLFIALISDLKTPEATERRDTCRHILDDAIADKVQILTSSVSIVEVRRQEVPEGQPKPFPSLKPFVKRS